jgi:hypothetical protein
MIHRPDGSPEMVGTVIAISPDGPQRSTRRTEESDVDDVDERAIEPTYANVRELQTSIWMRLVLNGAEMLAPSHAQMCTVNRAPRRP